MRTATVGFGEGEIWCAGPPGSCMIVRVGGTQTKAELLHKRQSQHCNLLREDGRGSVYNYLCRGYKC